MKHISILLFLFISFGGFSQVKKDTPLPIIDLTEQVNFGYRAATNRNIDIIVVHSTYAVNKDSFSVDAVLNQFKAYSVCAHYIIGRDGAIYLAVKEQNVAFHAGISSLPGTDRANLNGSSIGIEIINTTSTPPTDAQYESLLYLIQDIKMRHPIKYVVRHSDIAPGRKTDPWLFNWDVFLKMME